VPALYQYGALGALLGLIAVLTVVREDQLVNFAPLILLMVRGLGYVRQLIASARVGNEMLPFIDTLNAEIEELERHAAEPGGIDLDRFTGLRLEQVGYEYVPGMPVLRDVSLELSPGEMLGIVGPSGGGKSTLSLLLLRLRMPTSGAIIAGEHRLVDVSASSWARLAGYVPQDSRLILGSVADNIRFFREGHDLARVEQAARDAHLHDEIMQLPEGYDTVIGEGARDLSGGQRQRLAIARALLDSPQILILDEPTSALDARSEQLIGQTLEELKGRTTIVLIAHRPATLAYCDRIVRVANGTLEPADGARLG
jgi:ABC-type multidrug transport system fused ATPase/permease subunit